MPKRRPIPPYDNSITPPVHASASYYFERAADVISGLHDKSVPSGRYGRYDNPSWLDTESQLAHLCETEGALLFSSGMAAISTALLTFLRAGATAFFPTESYRQTRNIFRAVLPEFGISIVEGSIRHSDDLLRTLTSLPHKLDVVHLEMPSSPHMYLTDVEEVRRIVGPDAIVLMDCSFAPPPNFYPHRWGVDLALYSGTKYLSGHGDIVVGAMTGRRDLLAKVKWFRDTTGAVTTGPNAALLARSLSTLRLRMADVNYKAAYLASHLEAHPAVQRVLHTSLASHPHRDLAGKYLLGHGGVVTIELFADEKRTAEFVDRLKLPFMASNFGAPQTLVEQSTFFTYYEYSAQELDAIGVSRGTVRLAIGFADDLDEIIRDIDDALGPLVQ